MSKNKWVVECSEPTYLGGELSTSFSHKCDAEEWAYQCASNWLRKKREGGMCSDDLRSDDLEGRVVVVRYPEGGYGVYNAGIMEWLFKSIVRRV